MVDPPLPLHQSAKALPALGRGALEDSPLTEGHPHLGHLHLSLADYRAVAPVVGPSLEGTLHGLPPTYWPLGLRGCPGHPKLVGHSLPLPALRQNLVALVVLT